MTTARTSTSTARNASVNTTDRCDGTLTEVDVAAIHLPHGEPDFEPAPHIQEALREAVATGKNHYGPTLGLPQLNPRNVDAARELRLATMRRESKPPPPGLLSKLLKGQKDPP